MTTRGELPEAEIFDADGTLWNVQPIRHLLQRSGSRNFHAFHMESVNCEPNWEVLEGLNAAHAAGKAVLLVTARSTLYRNVTAFWLAMWAAPTDAMFMRRHGDQRADVLVKKDIAASILARWRVTRAWDDNPNVWGLWESLEIPVRKVPGWIDI